jgi:hypothetical protein
MEEVKGQKLSTRRKVTIVAERRSPQLRVQGLAL